MQALLLALTLAATPDTLDAKPASPVVELSLADALRIALDRSPVRTEAWVSRTQSGSRLARGIANFLPTVSASVGYGKSETDLLPEADWSWTGTLTLNQVIFDPNVYAGLASSIAWSAYYRHEAEDKQARLVYDVTADYLGLLKAELLRDVAAKTRDRASDNLRLVRQKKELGAASVIDVMRSEVQESQAGIDLLTAVKNRAVAAERFKATVGIADAVEVRPTEELVEPSGFAIEDPDSLLAEIERRNPGARLVDNSKAAAAWNTAAAIGSALPSVSAYWTSTYADSAFPSSWSRWDENDAVSCGIRASFPLLDLKSYVLNIVDARAESRRIDALGRKTRLQLRSSAVAAILGYQESGERFRSSSRNLGLNQKLFELAREQHRLGSISLLDFLTVEATLAGAEASYISALCDTYIQAAQISYLLGSAGPSEQGGP